MFPSHFLQGRKRNKAWASLSGRLVFSHCRTEPCEDTQQLQGLWSGTSNVQGDEEKKASTRSEPNDESAGLVSTSLGLQGGSEVFMSLRGHLDLPGKTAPHMSGHFPEVGPPPGHNHSFLRP